MNPYLYKWFIKLNFQRLIKFKSILNNIVLYNYKYIYIFISKIQHFLLPINLNKN